MFFLGENVVHVTRFSPDLLMIEIGIDDINCSLCESTGRYIPGRLFSMSCMSYIWWTICVKNILSYVTETWNVLQRVPAFLRM